MMGENVKILTDKEIKWYTNTAFGNPSHHVNISLEEACNIIFEKKEFGTESIPQIDSKISTDLRSKKINRIAICSGLKFKLDSLDERYYKGINGTFIEHINIHIMCESGNFEGIEFTKYNRFIRCWNLEDYNKIKLQSYYNIRDLKVCSDIFKIEDSEYNNRDKVIINYNSENNKLEYSESGRPFGIKRN